jgi:hypothetical protein
VTILTDDDGKELIALLNTLTDLGHGQLGINLSLQYCASIVDEPDPNSWRVTLDFGIPRRGPRTGLLEALRAALTDAQQELAERTTRASVPRRRVPAKKARKKR